MTDTKAYPLTWPSWIPRTPLHKITYSQFKTTEGKAIDELLQELRRIGARNVVISTNVPIRKDGRPYARVPNIQDHGVAVYFTRKGVEQCIACDKYKLIGENVRAIGKTIEAIRGIERWGSSQMVDAAFQGFAALPETAGGEAWWQVLEVSMDATPDEIQEAYRALSKLHHPDVGGDPEMFRHISEARRTGLEMKS